MAHPFSSRATTCRARFVDLIGFPHPILAFLCAVILGYIVLAGLSIASGFLVTDVLVDVHGIQTIDERFPRGSRASAPTR